MTIGIYCLIFSDGSRYIGQSNNIERRVVSHLKDMSHHSNHRVRNTFGLYGKPNWVILEKCSLDLLNAREIHYISTFSPALNLTRGGGYKRVVSSPVTSTHYSLPWWIWLVITGSIILGIIYPAIFPLVFIGYLCSK